MLVSFWQIEARSVDHFKSLNKGLEIKIIELQQKLIEQKEVTATLNNKFNKLTLTCEELASKARYHEEYLTLKEYVAKLEEELNERRSSEAYLQEQFNSLKGEMQISAERHKEVSSIPLSYVQ